MVDELVNRSHRGYNGNPNLKRTGVQIDWTAESISEYMKCAADPVYFAETYMKIIHVDRGLIPFKLYDFQKDIIRSMQNNNNTAVVSARQIGKSTTTCAFILWYILFQEDKTVALLANKGDTAREILGKVQLAYQHLPKWLQQGVGEWNKGSVILENNSRVLATSTSTDSIRGYTINLLFIDECAFIENWDEFFTSTLPTITSGTTTKIVLVSTPNGLNHFHTICENARKRKNEYALFEIPWQMVPGRDEVWKNKTLAYMNFDYEKFSQEYECSFIGSSGTLIAGWKLKELVVQTPINAKSGMYLYKEPKKEGTYVCIADCSHGKGLDYSAFHIIDVSQMPYEQVFVFRDNAIPPIEYAQTIHRIGTSYNNAAVLVESNDIGQQVVDSVGLDLEYEHILFTASNGRAGKIITNGISGGFGERGIRTSKTVKSVGCSLFKLLVEQNQLIINDEHTIHEMGTFSRKGKSYEAEEGKHDDLVMPLVLFAWLTDQTYFKEITDINTLARLRDRSEQQTEDELAPFTWQNHDGPDVIEEIFELGGAYMEDIKWLFG
jgi:hypothetical protein